jgi:hypothetical protein
LERAARQTWDDKKERGDNRHRKRKWQETKRKDVQKRKKTK